MSNKKRAVEFTVKGEPASKANSRKIVKINDKTRVIKSKKARDYTHTFGLQCPDMDPVISGDVRVTLNMYYATKRPDLDESIVLDCMQTQYAKNPMTGQRMVISNRVYLNDRQVKEKHVFWHLDRKNPRVEILVEEI